MMAPLLMLCLGQVLSAVAPAKPVAAAPAAAVTAPWNPKRSVVNVRITGQDHDWRAPWSKNSPWQRSYTGLVVEGHKILLTAAGLGNATLVEVQRLGEEQRYGAKVDLVDYEGPLALLSVEDPAFFVGLQTMPLLDVAPTQGDVSIHRWLASNQFENGRAFVRQVRVDDHGMSRVGVLTLDMTSTMSGGGASEIVAYNGAVAGLTTSKNDDVLLAIAAPVLKQFLVAAGRKPYPGTARAGMAWQKLLNPALRQHLGLNPAEGGVLVQRLVNTGSAATALAAGDVLLSLDGMNVDVSGQVEHPQYGKQSLGLPFSLGRVPGDKLAAVVLRGGKRLHVEMLLKRVTAEMERVPPYVVDRAPEYVVRGGLVFQPLTVPYLQTYGDWRRRGPMALLIAQELQGTWGDAPPEDRLVVLTSVLPDAVNLGYQDERDLLVRAINGKAVHSMEDVKSAFASAPVGDFHVVEFAAGQSLSRLVLNAGETEAAAARVQKMYGVPQE